MLRTVRFGLALLPFCWIGCDAAPRTPTTDNAAKPAAGSPSVKVRARLVAADRLDGKEDQIVHRCYVCALGMDGKEKNTAKYEGFEVHLCSQGCLEEFQANPEKLVLETPIPNKP
jgi:YHS domain-containing protein